MKKKFNKKLFFLMISIIVLLLIILFGLDYIDKKNNIKILELNKKVEHYFDLMHSQVNVSEKVTITKSEKEEFKKCNLGVYKDYRCFADFYEKYTIKNGLKQAFAHLNTLNEQFPEYFEACHIITHGIGHAQLQINKFNLTKSLIDFDLDKLKFTNLSTCASGYFHGLLEELAKNIKSETLLIDELGKVCIGENKEIFRSTENCYHGVGHAIYLQTEYELQKSLHICKILTQNKAEQFNCYTGVFMELIMDSKEEEVLEYNKLSKQFNFKLCDKIEDEYKPACYMESSVLFENYSKDKNNFSLNIQFCNYLNNKIYKNACIKQMAYRAITNNYKFPYKMCNALKDESDKVLCFAVYGHRLAGSIPSDYENALNDVCEYIENKSSKAKCLGLVYSKMIYLYFTGEEDLNL